MSLDVIYSHERNVVCYCKRLGKVNTHKQRADKTGVGSNGNEINIREGEPCHLKRLIGDAGDSLGMRTAGNLGHNSAIQTVGLNLRCDYI